MAYLLMTAGIMALGLFLASRLANACGFLVKGRALALAGLLACGIAVVLPILAPFLTRDYYWKLGLLVLIAALLVTAYNARLVKKDLAAAEQAAAETPASAAPPERASEQMPEAARQTEEQAGEARPDIPTPPVRPAAAANKESDSAAPALDAPAPPQAAPGAATAPPAPAPGAAPADARADSTAAQTPQETALPAADAAAQPPQETALPAADAAAQPPQETALSAAEPPQEEAASTADTARQAPQTEAPAVPIAPAAFTAEDSRPPRDAAPPPPPVTEEHASARHAPAAQMPEGHTPEKRPPEAAAQASEKHAPEKRLTEDQAPEASWAKDIAALTTLDAFLDYAYAAQQRGDIPRALAAYREALKRYSGDPYVPYLFIDLGNLCKQQARYADCIEVYRRGLRLPIIAENEAMAEEFRKNIRYLRIVYHILEKHQALATPFGSIPQTYRAEIETAYQAAQAQHHGS
ncbi:hypothetical protein [uncultured Selenomonas sp.]|uniref:hypothetical protein n=1 Tax=uncultured Selenomonas sp. TaxID=159275 RepID=UPI002805971A|nr:hypothetical protein [uncultured Selenomonas sp.]